MDINEEINFILTRRKISKTELAKKMQERTGKKYYQSLLSHKINDGSIKYSEMKLICDILDFKIQIFDNKANNYL